MALLYPSLCRLSSPNDSRGVRRKSRGRRWWGALPRRRRKMPCVFPIRVEWVVCGSLVALQ